MNSLAVILEIVTYLLNVVTYVIIAQAVLSWLVAFNVVNLHNQFVRSLYELLDRLTAPLLRPIRRFLPDLGGIDLSPMVLILVIIVLQKALMLLPALLLDTGLA